MYAESIDQTEAVTTNEEVEAPNEVANADERQTGIGAAREVIAKKEICPMISTDLVPTGMKMLENRKVLAVRVERERLSQEKSTLKACITCLADEYKSVTHLDLSSENAPQPSWQEFVRKTSNNLNGKETNAVNVD